MMQIQLAGFNIDATLIDKLPAELHPTPEALSAAYARISRSSKSVTALRSMARKDIQKSRASNESIIFEMGHSSVAEHAVFNFDIIGISRYLAEYLQRSRLASFTEKSQRYVTLSGDFVVPAEIRGSTFEHDYTSLMRDAFALYDKLFQLLNNELLVQKPEMKERDREGAAKEDARYILPLGTQTQMGMTINARSLEALLSRLAATPFAEAKELHQQLLSAVQHIAPSLVKYTNADYLLQDKKLFTDNSDVSAPAQDAPNYVQLVESSLNPDDTLMAALRFEQMGGSYTEHLHYVTSLPVQEKDKLWQKLFDGIKPYHKMPRAFELADFTFELTMSSSCFAQFKRHRLCTILRTPYRTSDGWHLPKSLLHTPYLNEIEKLLSRSEKLHRLMLDTYPALAPFVLTNAHRVRVLCRMNLRELYHFTRLRSDAHAQWEIQDLSHAMTILVQSVAPQAAHWLMGKSEMPAILS